MEEDLFKRFHNQRLGVSFFYHSKLNSDNNNNNNNNDKNQLTLDNENNLLLKYDDLKFKIIKLSSEANIGLQLFGLEDGLRSSLNENEKLITEETKMRQKKNKKLIALGGNETACTTTIYPTPDGNVKIKRYLVSHDGQGYLLAFQDKVENFESEQSQNIIQTILDTFKFID